MEKIKRKASFRSMEAALSQEQTHLTQKKQTPAKTSVAMKIAEGKMDTKVRKGKTN